MELADKAYRARPRDYTLGTITLLAMLQLAGVGDAVQKLHEGYTPTHIESAYRDSPVRTLLRPGREMVYFFHDIK